MSIIQEVACRSETVFCFINIPTVVYACPLSAKTVNPLASAQSCSGYISREAQRSVSCAGIAKWWFVSLVGYFGHFKRFLHGSDAKSPACRYGRPGSISGQLL
jgi:hypothetical protein